jgi:hypothetical protein
MIPAGFARIAGGARPERRAIWSMIPTRDGRSSSGMRRRARRRSNLDRICRLAGGGGAMFDPGT